MAEPNETAQSPPGATAPPGFGLPEFPGGDFFDAMRKRMAAGRQELKTPMGERGVELEPATRRSANVAANITRTWSTLWGWDGSSLRMVTVDRQGRLVVQAEDSPAGTVAYYTDTSLDLGENVITFSEVVDHVEIRGWVCTGRFYFRDAGDVVIGASFGNMDYYTGAYGIPLARFRGRCKSVNFYCVTKGESPYIEVFTTVF